MVDDPRLDRLSRRGFVASSTALLAGTALAAMPAAGAALRAPANRGTIPLPDAAQIRKDYQRMVDFGPRLPGHPNHLNFLGWLRHEFVQAGCKLLPCDDYDYQRWDPGRFGIDLIGGSAPGALGGVSYYVRSKPTPAGGIEAPLYYGGHLPNDGVVDTSSIPAGSIVVYEASLPVVPLKLVARNPSYVHLADDVSVDEYLATPYKRLWRTPAFPLEKQAARGAVGVIVVMDVSSKMIAHNFSPHASPYRPPLPALFVGKENRTRLVAHAKAGASARLTLEAEWVDGIVPSVTAILPGASDETIIIDSHTDGQNFIEENGAVALVQLARHFASLPPAQRLRRTVVFAGWPGHMSGTLPEATGWIRANHDLVDRAVAAVTIEHLGASEWDDVPGLGYAPTGRNEYMNFAATAGPLTDFVIDGFKKHNLLQHGAQPGPGVTTGAVFHETGVPHVGCISGPSYLLDIAPNGHMDKLDADLASRQTIMIGELIKRADKLSAEQLRGGDKTLGSSPVTGNDISRKRVCSDKA